MAPRKARPAGLPEIDWDCRLVLYRLYDATGGAIYFGTTRNWITRWRQHRVKEWWPEVARVKISLYPDFSVLNDAEKWAIASEAPRYNVVPLPYHVVPSRSPERTRTKQQAARFSEWRRKALGA
jgi:hypothetical protein